MQSNSLNGGDQEVEAIRRITVVPSILDVICRFTGMGFAAVARVTDQEWVACAVKDEINFGLRPGGKLQLDSTICNEIRQHHQAVVIDNVAEDKAYRTHHTPATYDFQSYISVPIVLDDGSFFGTLCAIDPKPHHLSSPEVVEMFHLYADLIAQHLQNIKKLDKAETELNEERKIGELRDQFIAILGHDLRNPLGAIGNSAKILERMSIPEQAVRFVNIIKDASIRMNGLIENILDFARGSMGEGIKINRSANLDIAAVLKNVVSELKVIWPDRKIDLNADCLVPVNCDSNRIAQLFSNLLGNALTHGQPDIPVHIAAQSNESEFILSVINGGEPIPEAIRSRLFQPFSRGELKPGQQGLGLGLYISDQIARAHLGILDVSSDTNRTCFTFRFPNNIYKDA